MARRPFDPAEQGWKKTEYRQGDVNDTASVRALVKGADVVVHLAFAILNASDSHARAERGRVAARVRGGGEGRCEAHLLRVERRRLRLPRRQPGLAHRGHPAARLARAPVLAPEGGGGARARRGAAAPFEHGGLRLPALHRRRPRGAHDARGDSLLPAQRGDARRRGAAAWLATGAEARDPGPRRPFPARARGRRGERVRRRRARDRRARSVQPRGQRHPHDVRRGRRARLVLGAGAEAAGGRHGRGGHTPAVHAGDGGVDPLGQEAGADEDRPGEEAAALEARSTPRARPSRRWPTLRGPCGTAPRSPPRTSRAGSAAWCRRPSRPRPEPESRPPARPPARGGWEGRAAR